ncbi:MAG TPA: hypothetical protein VGX96_07480 [Candidatus Elarobacter sp.]|jgi:hypothetical protein|nr:hypothetical protein [Candidatus Elarobacter sp.]
MSALDPLAAIVAGNADLNALIDAELAALAADAQALRALLIEDAVVTARVLPSNGLTDLVEIAGRRVAASLPPSVRPGDVLQVRVSGFDGERILLQIVGTGDAAAVETGPTAAPFPPGATLPLPVTNAGGGTSSAVPSAQAPSAPAASPAAAPATSAAAATSAPVPNANSSPGVSPAAAGPRAPVGPDFTSAVLRANVAQAQGGAESVTAQTPATLRQTILAPGQPTSIEARVAAARAAIVQGSVAGDSAVSAAAPNAARAAVAAPPSGAPAMPFVAPPQIAAKAGVAAGETVRVVPGAHDAAATSGMLSGTHAPPRATGLAAYAEPVALLRALRLPVTPSNVASAALALERPDRLPNALAALERALPRASDDPHVATLRTLLAFVGRIDPRSPALAAQIAGYVDHVVDGAEPKLATLLAATQAGAPSPDAPANASPSAAHGAAQQPVPAAVAAERAAALNFDLKQTMLAVATNPATPESLGPSLAGALAALTAVQVTAAQTLAANPNGIAFAIPLVTPHGTSTARISVQRDAPHGRGARLDAENFRIAFVLDTAHYGTVAIDLVTVGREVTVDVRTDAAPAMRAFRDALGTLTARLESLRYRVASAGASVGTTSTVAVEAPPARPFDPNAAVDRSA